MLERGEEWTEKYTLLVAASRRWIVSPAGRIWARQHHWSLDLAQLKYIYFFRRLNHWR